MHDKEIELQFERQRALLTNDGYFSRYRELIHTISCRAAWEQVESEMPFGLRRYTSYSAFKGALRLERDKRLPHTVRLSVVQIE